MDIALFIFINYNSILLSYAPSASCAPDLYGENAITKEHMQNNQSVRDMLGQRGIRPEELPPAEDIKKLERRVASEHKKIEKSSPKLPKRK